MIGGARRRGSDNGPAKNGGVDRPSAAGEDGGGNRLSEDSFYRVAVEKIMERERLSGGGGGGDDGGENGEGSDGSRSGDRGRRHRTGRGRHGLAKGGIVDPTALAVARGAAASGRKRRKVSEWLADVAD